MKITLIREEKESGKETVSTCEADALLEKIKTETKAAHVTALRTMLLYTTPDARDHYEHTDKLPRIYPSIEYGRSRDSSRKMKRSNGVVMLEVNDLAGLPEFDDIDEVVLKESNREFEQISPLEQLFHCYFRSPEEDEMGEWMTSMKIIEYLQGKSKTISLSNSCISTFGRILKKNQIESKRTKKGMQYEVIMLNK